MRKLIFCVAVIIFAANPCMGNEKRHVFQFASDYIKSLKYLEMIEEETKAFNRQYLNNIQYASATVTYLRNANSELLKAGDIMSKYKKSENQMIKDAAKSILFIYDNLSNIQLENLKMFEEFNSSEITDNFEKFDIESFMGKSRELQLSYDKFMEAFADATLMVTYVLVSWEPDEEGRLSYLAISQREREALTRQLEDAFGDEKREGMIKSDNYTNSCGAILLKVLAGGHKSSDER